MSSVNSAGVIDTNRKRCHFVVWSHFLLGDHGGFFSQGCGNIYIWQKRSLTSLFFFFFFFIHIFCFCFVCGLNEMTKLFWDHSNESSILSIWFASHLTFHLSLPPPPPLLPSSPPHTLLHTHEVWGIRYNPRGGYLHFTVKVSWQPENTSRNETKNDDS